MQRYIWIVLLAAIGLSACGGGGGNSTSTQTDIQFTISGMNGGWAKLIGIMGSQNYLVDSLAIGPEGTVHYHRDSVLPGGFYWLGLPGDSYVQLILDKDQEFTMTTDAFGINSNMVVEGSLDNQLLYENLVFEDDFRAKFDSVTNALNNYSEGTPEYEKLENRQKAMIEQRQAHIAHFINKYPESFFTIYKKAGQNPELKEPKLADGKTIDESKQVYLYRNEFWDNVDMGDVRLLRTPVINNKLTRYFDELVDRNPDSLIKYSDQLIRKSQADDEMFKFVVNTIAIKYEKSDIMGGEAVFVHIIDNFFTDELAFWSNPKELGDIRHLADEMRPSLLGNTAQDITCYDPAGNKVSLYDLKTELIVLYMYSHNCEHCQERTPDMVQVFKDYRNKGLSVYSLCVDVEKPQWEKFISEYGMTGMPGFVNAIDPKFESEFYKKYHVDITPEVYLIRNSDKTIIAKDLHPNQLPETLDRELKGA